MFSVVKFYVLPACTVFSLDLYPKIKFLKELVLLTGYILYTIHDCYKSIQWNIWWCQCKHVFELTKSVLWCFVSLEMHRFFECSPLISGWARVNSWKWCHGNMTCLSTYACWHWGHGMSCYICVRIFTNAGSAAWTGLKGEALIIPFCWFEHCCAWCQFAWFWFGLPLAGPYPTPAKHHGALGMLVIWNLVDLTSEVSMGLLLNLLIF